jgi:hypothetical protein
MARQPVRWKFYDPQLLWLFPLSYAIHFSEEFLTQAPVLLWSVRLDRARAQPAFVAASVVALALMIAGVSLAQRGPRFHWIVPALAVAVLLNTTGHLVGSALAGAYSAGMMTAVIFWIPLALLTLLRAVDQASAKQLATGIAVGVIIELVVIATITRLEP